MSSETISIEALAYLRLRLENRSLGITHKVFPLVFNNSNRVCVTEDTIYIQIPKEISVYEIRKLYAFQIHESAHILFSSLDFEACKKAYFDNHLDEARAKDLLNIMEDYRVNVLIHYTHRGAGKLMDEIHRDMCKGKEFSSALNALLPVLSGYNPKLNLTKTEQTKLDKAVALVKPIAKCRNLDESLRILPEVYKIIFPDGETKEIEDVPMEMPEDTSSFIESNPRTRDKKRNTKEAVEKAEEQPEEKEKEKSAEEEAELKKDIERTVEETAKIQKETAQALTEDLKEIDEITEEGLEEEEEGDSEEGNKPGDNPDMSSGGPGPVKLKLIHEYQPNAGSQVDYDIIKTNYGIAIRRIIREMRTLMVFNRRWSESSSDGRLNSRKVYKILVNDNASVFRKKNQKDIGDIAVLLLVDNSGSMSGKIVHGSRKQKISYAKDCCIILHEVLSSLKIRHMIVGYTADREQALEWGTRLDGAVNQIVYKTWNQRGTALNILSMSPLNNNCDGGTILAGIKYFKKVHERKKLIIVISDGQPACKYYQNLTGDTTGEKHTVEAQRDAIKHGIKLINIGIGDNYWFPENYVNKIKIDDVEKLPSEFLKLLRRELRN